MVKMTEFELIDRFFKRATTNHSFVDTGIGDDCALLQIPPGQQLAVTTDTLLSGVHFFADVDPFSLGHKVLAVNLSDLAAMAAQPRTVTLSLTLPDSNEGWLSEFCLGFFQLADRFGVDLIGGDTTRGPLSITVQAMGVVPAGLATRRNSAQPGDVLFVTGTIGDPGLALAHHYKKIQLSAADFQLTSPKLNQPEPRVAQGLAVRRLASAAIDVSDGLLADLGHLLAQSAVGAEMWADKVPLSSVAERFLAQDGDVGLLLTSGDDYELVFAVPPQNQKAFLAQMATTQCPVNAFGVITAETDFIVNYKGMKLSIERGGYNHFN